MSKILIISLNQIDLTPSLTPMTAALSHLKIFIPASVGIIFTSAQASAASITINGSPTINVTDAIEETTVNPISATQISPTQGKITGDGLYTSTGADATIEIIFTGIVSADVGDNVTLDYDFSFNLTGGQLDWEITTSLLVDLGAFTLPVDGPTASGGPITSADSGAFNGSDGGESPVALSDTPLTATITLNWTGSSQGDTLAFNIPNNSIDFAINPVPEPSSALMCAMGGLFLMRRKRR